MNVQRIHARAVAGLAAFGFLLWATPGHAQFSCNTGSLAGNCTIDAPQAVTGDTTVVGDLIVTSTGSLDYGGGTAEITVGGNLTVDGTIGARGPNGSGGSNGSNNGTSPGTADGTDGTAGTNGGNLTINVDGDVTVSDTGAVTVRGGNGGNGGGGGNVAGNQSGLDAGDGGDGDDAGDGGSLIFSVGGDVLIADGATVTARGGNGGTGGSGGQVTGQNSGDGGDGGDGGNGGAGGDLTFNVCGSFTEESGAEITASGGTGGDAGNGGTGRGGGNSGGDGGDGGDGGGGGPLEINADGQITLAGEVKATSGNPPPGASSTGGSGMNGASAGSGGAAGNLGSVGSILLSTALGSIDTSGATIAPSPDILVNQGLICGAEDPLPDGSTTFTQGFYGASPGGEALVDDILNGADDPEGLCLEIVGILNDLGFDDTAIAGGAIDCSDSNDREAVALFLTGEVGPGSDDGFLPSGINPGDNIGAQKITLLINLNLDAVLFGGDIPIEAGYFINIDPVEDIVGGVPTGNFFDPILTTNGELGSCADTTPADGVCDAAPTLTALGEKVEDLDIAGTTVQDILDAADSLISSGDPDITVNGVTLTRGDVTGILGLINESYDEGTPTGFVTAFDAD